MANITLRNISHSYDGQQFALKHIEHTWKQGGAYALLGPSGCGKSTLLNLISGLLQPTHGDVLFDDKIVNTLSPQQRNIAQVFQFPVVYEGMTVRENLAFPLKNIRQEPKEIAQKVKEIADLLGLSSKLDHSAKKLTADAKQKISMGRGLVRDDVSAILFDEPLTVIDPHLKWTLRRKLKEIHQQLDITMIYVTHDQLEAATFADEIAVMYQGDIVQFGSPQSLFDQPNHTFVGHFIGSPGMNFIAAEWHQGQLYVNNQKIRISAAQRQSLLNSSSENIQLGIRPEHVELVGGDHPNGYPATLKDIESFGTHQIVTINFNQRRWKVRVTEQAKIQANNLYVHFPPAHLKLYIDEYLCGEANRGETDE